MFADLIKCIILIILPNIRKGSFHIGRGIVFRWKFSADPPRVKKHSSLHTQLIFPDHFELVNGWHITTVKADVCLWLNELGQSMTVFSTFTQITLKCKKVRGTGNSFYAGSCKLSSVDISCLFCCIDCCTSLISCCRCVVSLCNEAVSDFTCQGTNSRD